MVTKTNTRIGVFALGAALGLAACLLAAPMPALAEEGLSTAKDEVVYIKGSATGATEGIYVVNIFETEDDATICDAAAYEEIVNLTTSDELVEEDGTVVINTTAETPFYYQGMLDAATELPWDISVTYFLNGEEVTAEEAQGASGALQVVFDVKANTEAESVSDFANGYILQAQGTFANDTFAIFDAGDATVARSGSDEVITCLVLPGEDATFTISGLASDFSYDGWQVAGMQLSMAISMSDDDTGELTDAVETLESATTQLSGGASTLFGGTEELASGASSVSAGAQNVASGASELSSGVDSAVSGLSELSSAGATLSSGWATLYSGITGASEAAASLVAGSEQFEAAIATSIAAYKEGAEQYESAMSAYAQASSAAQSALTLLQDSDTTNDAAAIDALSTALASMDTYEASVAQTAQAAGAYSALCSIQESYSELGSGLETLAGLQGLAAVASGAESFDSGLASYLSATDSAASQASALASGAEELATGSQQVASGAASVASATETLAEGASELASGTEELASSVSGMDDEIIDAIEEAIDEKLGADFENHSFVEASNTNVDSVQFVYVLSGVSEPDDDDTDTSDAEEDDDEDEGIIDRLLALLEPQE